MPLSPEQEEKCEQVRRSLLTVKRRLSEAEWKATIITIGGLLNELCTELGISNESGFLKLNIPVCYQHASAYINCASYPDAHKPGMTMKDWAQASVRRKPIRVLRGKLLPEWARHLNGNTQEVADRIGIGSSSLTRWKVIARSGNRALFEAVESGRIPAGLAERAIKQSDNHDQQYTWALERAPVPAAQNGHRKARYQHVCDHLDVVFNDLTGLLQTYGPDADHKWLAKLSGEQKRELSGHVTRMVTTAKKLARHIHWQCQDLPRHA